MPVNVVTRLRPGQHGVVQHDPLYGGRRGVDGNDGLLLSLHSRHSSLNASSTPSSIDMTSPPASTNAGAASGSRIGRPPQWTVSRSRKLARLYLYSTLPIEKIIKVLEDDGFSPRKNSAQKTIHKMLDNDPRYLRPESRVEMSKRLKCLAMSPNRRKRKASKKQYAALGYDSKEGERGLSKPEATSSSGKSVKTEDSASLDYATSPDTLHSGYLTFPPRRHDVKDPREESCLAGIHDIKRRVSNCSTQFAMQLSSLVKEFTISICSDDRSSGRRPSAALSEGSEPADIQDINIATEPYEPFPDPGFALPGDFLTAHTRSCADFPGQQHGEGDCWCSIAKHTSAAPDSWLLTAGELSDRARHVLRQPLPAHLNWRDSFGNTPLHLFAALDGYQERLLGMVRGSGGGELAAVNSADQSFLHVLNLEWFNGLSYPSSPLEQLLALVAEICPGLVYETDAYGRTFFHRAYSLIRDRSLLAGFLSLFDLTLVSRDAFGFNPIPDTDTEGQSPYIPPRRIGSLSPQVEDIARASPSGKPKSVASEGSLLAYHARLVRVIHSSYTNPSIEDADGRNGLHCLAEAILDQQAMDRHVRSSSFPSSASRPNLKRKLDLNDPAPSTPIGTATAKTPSSSPPALSGPLSSSSGSSPAEGILPARLRHLYALLEPSVSVSVSHYDRCGYTPLMAFIEHIPDEQDDKAKTLQAILETLVRAGASGDEAVSSRRRRLLEARNRRGETPLLMAARLGRKVALATLLEGGANVHARDADGRGLLEVLDAEVGGARARAEVGLYARLEACRALLTGRREWGVGYVHHGEPAIVREWRMR